MAEAGTNARRLFIGSCAAITALAVSFMALSAVMYSLKTEFLLSNAEVGLIGGAGLWGMALSQVGFSMFVDTLGMRDILRLAWLGHAAGVLLFVLAGDAWGLFAAALLIAIANGMIEAVCNPLVATLFPTRKAVMLNRLHLWFPGGIVLGGLTIWALSFAQLGWRASMLVTLIPVTVYALLLARAKFPATELAQHGAGFGDAVQAVLRTPLLWLLLALMAVTMSLELGPNRWIPAVLEAGGLPGVLVLVLINGVMAAARGGAHEALGRFSPPIVLCVSIATAGIGLFWLSYSHGLVETLAAALVFAIGIALVWPTMMGFVAERAPRTGALGLGLMAAAGSLAVGLVTTPLLGRVADDHLAYAIPASEVRALAADIEADSRATEGLRREAATIAERGEFPTPPGEFLRRAASGEGASSTVAAGTLLARAENLSGLYAFRLLAPLALFASLIFALIAFSDWRRGGYAAQVEAAHLSKVTKS